MATIRTNRIVSALPDNEVDYRKVEIYAQEMKENDELTGHNGFPEILGYFDVINEADLGIDFLCHYDLPTERITKKHLGLEIFRVTDGHHRAIAATKAGIWCLDVDKDNSGFVRC